MKKTVKTINYFNLFIFLVTSQVRFVHTDLQVPDFSDYRRDAVKRANRKSNESEEQRKSFTYLVVGGN